MHHGLSLRIGERRQQIGESVHGSSHRPNSFQRVHFAIADGEDWFDAKKRAKKRLSLADAPALLEVFQRIDQEYDMDPRNQAAG